MMGGHYHEAIVHAARAAKLAGIEVIRGITGWGGSGHIHESWRGFSCDMPLIIELIDTDEKIDAFIPTTERLRADALVIRPQVQILELQGLSESVRGVATSVSA